mmetsp:Transcript_4814/g.8034  ORF Transcript_4814/g.8034 Transcript_4814/m.8034 type:complete len:341 (-) Transcript_4814:92-1114(-)|eukprot:CAMPEP_0196143380 /NCGR_PEP_ID=MMETSP0910-20130528/13211_1 /TAXON_ID=49265 /ORGANISM="Thalassiosira rotula, Strain GSO102" /LENGTH=340 /DNA_ID=CAMNT_0041404825 /DNA_START=278 /DNA_END=1300 /DNA_ORIENTATION=+
MTIKQRVAILAAALALPSTSAFSPSSSSSAATDTRLSGGGGAVSTSPLINTALDYRSYDDDHPHFYDVERIVIAKQTRRSRVAKSISASAAAAAQTKKKSIRKKILHTSIVYSDIGLYDVDGDRTSLHTLLDPPAAPLSPLLPKKIQSTSTTSASTTTSTSSSTTTETESTALRTPQDRQASLRPKSRARTAPPKRTSPILSLHTISDYESHILHSANENVLSIVRFKAPWCQTCRTTNVAYERMASKLTKLSSASPKNKVKFYQVELDGKEETTALKDHLEIEGVPQGVLHHPSQGIEEQKIKLGRSNLSALKKNLERYCTYTRGEDGLQGGMLLDGLN